MSLIDITTYNKLLDEKTRLVNSLKRLQDVSNNALSEFGELKTKYSDLCDEYDAMKQKLAETEHECNQMSAKLSQSEYLIKKLCKASKSAITEFRDVKKRYLEEYEKRYELEQINFQLLKRLDLLTGGQSAFFGLGDLEERMAAAASGRSAPAPPQKVNVSHSGATQQALMAMTPLEKELSQVKVQLQDTLKEFTSFKEATVQKQRELEERIWKDMKAISKKRESSKRESNSMSISSETTAGSAQTKQVRAKDDVTKIDLLKRAQSKNALDKGLEELNSEMTMFDGNDGHSSIDSDFPLRLLKKSSTDLLAATKYEPGVVVENTPQTRASPSATKVAESRELSPSLVRVVSSSAPISSFDEAVEDEDLASLAKRLRDSSIETKTFIEKRASRVLEAARKVPAGQEFSMNRRSSGVASSWRGDDFSPFTLSMYTTMSNESGPVSFVDGSSHPVPPIPRNIAETAPPVRESIQEIVNIFDEVENELGMRL